MKFVIGIDIGATFVRIGLFTLDGKLISYFKDRTIRGGDEFALASQIINLIRSNIPREFLDNVIGIGIGSVGPLDMRRGIILNAPNLGIRYCEIVRPLLNTFFVEKIVFVNDCVAAVWGEKVFGWGVNVNNLVYITFSTGIGGGIIVNGHLLLGKDGNAHEIGHIVIDYRGTMKCGCGCPGHWEAYCGGANIPKYVRYLIETEFQSEISSSLLHSYYLKNDLRPEVIFECAKKGDGLALKIVDRICLLNAIGVANVINAYDPDLVVFGGSIILNNPDLMMNGIRKYVQSYTVNRLPEFKITKLGDNVVLYGAAALVIKTPPEVEEFIFSRV